MSPVLHMKILGLQSWVLRPRDEAVVGGMPGPMMPRRVKQFRSPEGAEELLLLSLLLSFFFFFFLLLLLLLLRLFLLLLLLLLLLVLLLSIQLSLKRGNILTPLCRPLTSLGGFTTLGV